MRIACLQFASRVGDVDNNLSRADAVLNRVALEELDNLDLLVLPELSFTGYNFRSLQHIHPCLEEAGSGISSLWAQTTALKHDCTVVVGYAEKVDVSAKWPASPEYYNSALIVNGDGDAVGNYRKSFLYYTDETWALEGPDGFLRRKLPGLGNVALGIGTDLNPYKLEAPWDAFEFGLHVLKTQANLVILTMAWQTHQDAATFARNPQEPDLETLVYWVQRLEPVIRANNEDEVIVVFCNRTGAEEEVTYTGTSAVIGVRKGEVFVYGVLGRGVDDILVVDTDRPPRCKLTDVDSAAADDRSVSKTGLEPKTNGHHTHSVFDHTLDESEVCQCHLVDAVLNPPPLDSPRTATSPKLPWLAQSDHPSGTPTDSRSPTRLQIPTRPPKLDEYTIPTIDSAITDDIIDTPGFSAFPYTPAGLASTSTTGTRPSRPKLAIPSSSSFTSSPSPWRFPNSNKQSPYPWHAPSFGGRDGWSSSQSTVFGGGGALTPITPFDEDGWSSTPIDAKAPGWFWRHEPRLEALRERVGEEEEEEEGEDQGKGRKGGKEGGREVQATGQGQSMVITEPSAGGRGSRGETARGDGEHQQQHQQQHQQHQHQGQPRQPETKSAQREALPEPQPQPRVQPHSQAGPEEAEPQEEHEGDGPLLTNDWADLAHVLNTFRSRDRERNRAHRPNSTALDDLRSSSRADSRPSSPKSRNLSGSRSRVYRDGDGNGDGDGDLPLGYARESAEDAWRRAASKSSGRKPLLLGRSNSFDASGGGTRPRLPRRQSRLRHETYLGAGEEGEAGDEFDEDVGWSPRMNGTESVLVGSAGAAGFGV